MKTVLQLRSSTPLVQPRLVAGGPPPGNEAGKRAGPDRPSCFPATFAYFPDIGRPALAALFWPQTFPLGAMLSVPAHKIVFFFCPGVTIRRTNARQPCCRPPYSGLPGPGLAPNSRRASPRTRRRPLAELAVAGQASQAVRRPKRRCFLLNAGLAHPVLPLRSLAQASVEGRGRAKIEDRAHDGGPLFSSSRFWGLGPNMIKPLCARVAAIRSFVVAGLRPRTLPLLAARARTDGASLGLGHPAVSLPADPGTGSRSQARRPRFGRPTWSAAGQLVTMWGLLNPCPALKAGRSPSSRPTALAP